MSLLSNTDNITINGAPLLSSDESQTAYNAGGSDISSVNEHSSDTQSTRPKNAWNGNSLSIIRPKQEQPVKSTISDSVKPVPEQPYESKKDSLIKQLYPICVIEVNKSTYKGYKWEVIAENGLMYYTNKKPKIGDPAFYIGSDSETLYWTK
jgi:hypothetical protein